VRAAFLERCAADVGLLLLVTQLAHPHRHLRRSLLVADVIDHVLLGHEIETLVADQVEDTCQDLNESLALAIRDGHNRLRLTELLQHVPYQCEVEPFGSQMKAGVTMAILRQ
jgi:hypothetical protein